MKILLSLTTLLTFFIFVSCDNDSGTNIPNVENQFFSALPDSVNVSLKNDRLVFESEDALQKCISYLNAIGDDSLEDFENELGFYSFRKAYEGYSSDETDKIEDKILRTLINPEKEIEIAGYLFTMNLKDEKTTITPISSSLKSSSMLDHEINIDWEDDAFDIISNNGVKSPELKGYCGNNDAKYTWENGKGNPGHYSRLQAKVCFQRAGFYNSIIIKFKLEKRDASAFVYDMHYKTINSWYRRRHRHTTHFSRENQYKKANGSQNEISHRPYSGTRRVKRYDITVDYDFIGYNPWNNIEATRGGKRLHIKCN